MSEGKRPGGLTALAVFNFIGCGFDLLLGVLGSVFVIFLLQSDEFKEADREASAEAPPAKEAPAEAGPDADADAAPDPASRKKERDREQFKQLRDMGVTVGNLTIKIVLYAALALLLLLSGIGYLKQKRFLGRKLGTIYAIASIATTAWELSLLPSEFRSGSATIGIVIAGVYPLITLLMINTIFKEDFTN